MFSNKNLMKNIKKTNIQMLQNYFLIYIANNYQLYELGFGIRSLT